MTRFILAVLPLALAACQLEVPGNRHYRRSEVHGRIDRCAGDTPTGTTRQAAPEPAPITAIPPALQGRWGMVPADCTSTRGDNKGLLRVSADPIVLRIGRPPGLLTTAGARRLAGNYASTGEGMNWTRRDSTSARGTADAHPHGRSRRSDEPGGPFIYTRCAA